MHLFDLLEIIASFPRNHTRASYKMKEMPVNVVLDEDRVGNHLNMVQFNQRWSGSKDYQQ